MDSRPACRKAPQLDQIIPHWGIEMKLRNLSLLGLFIFAGCQGNSGGTGGSPSSGATPNSGGPVANVNKPNPADVSAKGTIGVSVLTMTNPFFKVIGENLTSEAKKAGY